VFKKALNKMECIKCKNNCIKRGFNKTVQRWFCKQCEKYFQATYTNKLCTKADDAQIVLLNNEGVGISGIGRILKISKSNVINRIRKIAACLVQPTFNETKQEYEVDEMYTYIKDKSIGCYITYALNRATKRVTDFIVGGRTKVNLDKVITTIKSLEPKKIFTDKLNIYNSIIDKALHVASAYKINHIERFNLTLRTHLKRLTRKTICFSKSKNMLENCLRLYFWKSV
jgi:IS1 family transposase/transposase-like protein